MLGALLDFDNHSLQKRRSGVLLETIVTTSNLPDASTHLDTVILDCAKPEWQRVTMLIAATVDVMKAQELDINAQTIAGRIYALTEAKALEAKGNIRRWRTSEIRRSSP